MDMSLLPAIAGFALVASITPGPNNIMVMTSGANFGFRPTTPHILGIVIGFLILIVLTGLGLMALFDRFPALNVVRKSSGPACPDSSGKKWTTCTPPAPPRRRHFRGPISRRPL